MNDKDLQEELDDILRSDIRADLEREERYIEEQDDFLFYDEEREEALKL